MNAKELGKVPQAVGKLFWRRDLLVVVDFGSTKKLDELEFNFIPVWIRVLDLPMG